MDNAHAHPPPKITPPQTRSFRDTQNTPTASSPPTRQQRLLQNRNARFPAKKLSMSGISARFSQLIRASDDNPRPKTASPRNQENISSPKQRGHQPASHSFSSLGILEEITNTINSGTNSMSKRNRSMQKSQNIPIFQDSPERALLAESPFLSPEPAPLDYPLSIGNSPVSYGHIKDSFSDMGLREISGNARRVSNFDSPTFGGSVKNGRRRKSTTTSKFNSEDYIEHIERELELVKDAVYSPNSNRPWKEKLKAARTENERLRKEIAEMRVGFESEVQKTVEHMTATEVDLRRKIRSLEEELENKEGAIQDLESEHEEKRLDQSTIDTLRSTIDRLEQDKRDLEDSNNSISKRNEVLTHLLAMSPTKSQHTFELGTPARALRNPRPRSLMIPRVPSSPSAHVASRPQSMAASPASAAGYFSASQTSSSPSVAHSAQADSHEEFMTGGPNVPVDMEMAFGSSTCGSQISDSPSTADRPLSIASTGQPPHRQPSRRRTRRFLTGSTQLKPLLLGTLTGENGVLYSSTPVTSPNKYERRDISAESVDPTTMYLSRSSMHSELDLGFNQFLEESSPASLQNARDLAYQSLEGTLKNSETRTGKRQSRNGFTHSYSQSKGASRHPRHSQIFRRHTSSTPSRHSLYHDFEEEWLSSPVSFSPLDDFDRTILPDDIEHFEKQPEGATDDVNNLDRQLVLYSSPSRSTLVEVPEPLFSPASRRSHLDGAASPSVRRRITRTNTHSSTHVGPPTAPKAQPDTVLPHDSYNKRRPLREGDDEFDDQAKSDLALYKPDVVDRGTDPRSERSSRASSICLRSPSHPRGPLEMLERNVGGRPLAAVTIKTIYGTLSRYTTYIREMKRDPLALARRVIANAWHTNWALMGKLSWWVLGLFLGPSKRQYESPSWDWEDYDADAIAERCCRRCSREITSDQRGILASGLATSERHVRFDESQNGHYRTHGSTSSAKPALKKEKPTWSRSLLLWGKFSVAIMLAVGGAVVKGPGEMLKDADIRSARGGSGEYRSASCSSQSSDGDYEPAVFDSCGGERKEQRKSKRQTTTSPPPSARSLLSENLTPLSFDSSALDPTLNPNLGVFYNEAFAQTLDFETLKPKRARRTSTDRLFSSSSLSGGGGAEYDPETAGLGLYDFDITMTGGLPGDMGFG